MDEKRLKARSKGKGRDDLFVESLTVTGAAEEGGGNGLDGTRRRPKFQLEYENNGRASFDVTLPRDSHGLWIFDERSVDGRHAGNVNSASRNPVSWRGHQPG